MRAVVKSALGIDVTETQISTVLLGKTAEGFRVLEATQCPLPDGTFEQGRVADAAQLLKVLKAVRGRNKTRTQHVAMSLPVISTVTRVVRLDEEDPQRIAQFVQNEIKEYAALSGREVVSDYRVVVPAKHNVLGKVLVTAMDKHLAARANWICRRAGLGVGVVEPASMACLKAAGDVQWASRSPSCMLPVVLKEGRVNLCVLRGGILEFVRTETIATPSHGLQKVCSRVADEINTVIRFYDRESTAGANPWKVVILDDDDLTVADEVVRFLKANVVADVVDVRTRANCSDAIGITPPTEGLVSITALGLAMRFLVEDKIAPRVSLLPPEAIRAKSVRTNMLLAANALAALMLVVVLIVGGLSLMTKRVTQSVAAMQETELKRGQQTLVAAASQLACIEQHSALLTDELAALRHVSESHVDVHWTELFDDIKDATPEVLRITDLSVDVASDLFVEGLSQSYEAVHRFVEMLNRSEGITHASIVKAGRRTSENELVRYVIRCTLASGETP